MTHKDTSLFMAYARGELTFDEYIAAEDAVDPVDGSHASAVAPAPLWWLAIARRMDAWRESKQNYLEAA